MVSDHGFGPSTGRYPVKSSVPFDGEHRLEGTIIVAGSGVVEGNTIYGATIYDVAPTVLELLGLKPPARFEGNSLVAQILEAPAAPLRDVVEEEEDENGEPIGSDDIAESENIREQELERLRSLGYVQ